jgi:UrcA family protein
MSNFPDFSAAGVPATSTGSLIEASRRVSQQRGLWGAVAFTLALGALQAGVAAHAVEAAPASKMVSLAGLNLARSSDLAIARERLQAAAAEVCRSESGKLDAAVDATCKQETYETAMATVNAYRSTLAIVTEMRSVAGVPSKLVSLSDLDLSKSAHLDIVRTRLMAASKEVCKVSMSQISFRPDSLCVQDTYAAAMKKVSDHLVTAGMAAGAEHLARIY